MKNIQALHYKYIKADRCDFKVALNIPSPSVIYISCFTNNIALFKSVSEKV